MELKIEDNEVKVSRMENVVTESSQKQEEESKKLTSVRIDLT